MFIINIQKFHHIIFFIILTFYLNTFNSFVNCCYSKSNHPIIQNVCTKSNDEKESINPKMPINILTTTNEEKQKFLNSFDIVLTDIDGVLWNPGAVFPGAGDVINNFKRVGKKVAFVSNNSVRPADDLKNKFEELNIDLKENDIYHPSRTTVDYLKQNNFDGLIYLIGSKFFKNTLTEAGFKVIDGPNEILQESFKVLAKHIFQKDPVQAVIMDTDFNVSGCKLIKAQMYLLNPKCLFIVGATDRLLPVQPSISLIGPGNYAEIVERVSGKKPIILGKPGKDLCKVLEENLNIKDPKRTLMIGDTLDQDVTFGNLCGFQTLVVLTGDAKLDDFKKPENSERLPDYYINSLADLKILFDKI